MNLTNKFDTCHDFTGSDMQVGEKRGAIILDECGLDMD